VAAAPPDPTELQIRKYPNRRFYDATRSRHVTMADLYDLVAAGRRLHVIDSATGADITNVVLMQMILERDADKLAVFPPEILHQVIRTRQQFLGAVFEDFFRQTAQAQRAAQDQWTRFVQGMQGAMTNAGNPAEWTRAMAEALGGAGVRGAADSRAPDSPASTHAPAAPDEQTPRAGDDVAELRAQVAELSRRLEQLSPRRSRKGRRRRA
jgi:polyhydroxyalkanoate synthesis repressor PhaR